MAFHGIGWDFLGFHGIFHGGQKETSGMWVGDLRCLWGNASLQWDNPGGTLLTKHFLSGMILSGMVNYMVLGFIRGCGRFESMLKSWWANVFRWSVH